MKYILSLFLLAASSLVVSRFAPAPTPLAPLSIGGEEDREAMAHEEFLRLRNPQTNMIPEGIKEREHDFVEALAVNKLTKGWSAASGDTEIHLDESQLVQHGIERTGGRTRSLVFDCTNSSVMLAGAVGGGVWRSTNGGVTWKKTTSDGYIHSVSALVQDGRPGHQHEWYYGSGEGYSSGGYPIYGYDIGIGIFKSIDSGKSWSLLPSTSVARASRPGSPFHLTHNLALDHTRKDSTIVYAACNGAVMRSNDAGVTWSAVLGDTSATTVVWSDVTVASNGVVYASLGSSSKSGIWRSADGVTWTNISTGTAVGPINSRTRVVTAPSNPNVLWVYKNSANTPLFRYQYVSGNGSGTGGEWESRSSTMTGLLQTQSGYNMCLAVHPTNENIVLVGGTNLYLTTDGFMTIPRINHVSGYSKSYVQNRQWNPFTPETYLYDTSHPDMHAAVFAPNDSTTVFIGCDGGVFKTTNIFKDSVVRWSSLNNGYNVGQFYSTAIDPSGIRDGAVIGGAQDNNSNIGLRNGKPMEWVLGGDGMVCEMSAGHKAVYPSYQGGQVYRVRMNETLDSALEWVNMRPRGGQFDFTAPLRLHPVSDSILYMIGGASLWVNWNATQRAYTNDTTTSSQNWRSYPMSAYATGGLSAMGLCTSSPNTVYLGTKSGVVLKVDSLQRTSAIVKTVTGTDMPKGAYVSNITVDPLDNASVFVTFSNYEVLSVFHSTDAGSTWECISGNLEEKSNGLGAGPSCRWLEVLHFNGDTLYLLATSSGVFSTHTLDAMNTVWEQFRAIPNVACTMIDVRSTDGFVAVATHGLGMFTTYAIGGGNSSSVQSLDLTFSALGVYPQPATGSMTIRCRLQRDAELSFCIRDVSGRSLLTTPASWFSAGEQLIPVDVSTLAQGWYSLELRASGRRSPVAIGFIKQ